jgi:methionyl-tRNA formyltransferase
VICKEGVIILKKVKIEGKKELKIKDVINGDRKFVHYRF